MRDSGWKRVLPVPNARLILSLDGGEQLLVHSILLRGAHPMRRALVNCELRILDDFRRDQCRVGEWNGRRHREEQVLASRIVSDPQLGRFPKTP